MGKNGKRIILMVVFGLIVTLSVVAVTYAYYIGGVNNDKAQTANLSTGTMALTFADNDNGFGGAIEFGDTITKKFTIQNTGTLDASASIEWFNLTNLYLYGSLVYDLEYSETLNGTYTKIVDEARVPTTDNNPTTEMLAARITVPAKKTYYYNLKVTLKDLTDLDQTTDLSAHFFTQFQMKGLNERISDSYSTLANLGLSVRSNEPNFKKLLTSVASYRDFTFSKESSVLMTEKGDYYITYADSYIFDETTFKATLINPKVGKYSEIYNTELVGKYVVNRFGYQNDSTPHPEGYYFQLYKMGENSTLDKADYYSADYKFNDYSDTGIYGMEDDYGTSYYFRGAVTNNYVKFGKWADSVYRGYRTNTNTRAYREYYSQTECQNASSFNIGCELSPVAGKDMWWRIIRINGDGSLRIIYDGVEGYKNSASTTNRYIGFYPYNAYANSDELEENAYLGYMYGSSVDLSDCSYPNCANVSQSYEDATRNDVDSDIKKVLDNWYNKNLLNSYDTYISDNIFCNDRSIAQTAGNWHQDDTALGYGLNVTYYGAYNRLQNFNPSLSCPRKEDSFTKNDNINGNGKLTYPVGLFTADELMLAGFTVSDIPAYASMLTIINRRVVSYLGQKTDALTMTPGLYDGYNAFMLISDGAFINELRQNVGRDTITYPVINLSKEAAKNLIGNGTILNPFRLE